MSLAVDCIGHLSTDINVLGHVKGMHRSCVCNNTQILLHRSNLIPMHTQRTQVIVHCTLLLLTNPPTMRILNE